MIATLKTLFLTIALSILFLGARPAQAASQDDFNQSIDMVRIGDAQPQVLRFLGREPDRTQSSNVLGLHKSVLEFDVGPFQHELVFYAGHLVSKSVRSRKPTLLDRFSL